jgi:hypothetical protein
MSLCVALLTRLIIRALDICARKKCTKVKNILLKKTRRNPIVAGQTCKTREI